MLSHRYIILFIMLEFIYRFCELWSAFCFYLILILPQWAWNWSLRQKPYDVFLLCFPAVRVLIAAVPPEVGGWRLSLYHLA
jgi:hypothetical protein